MWYSVGDTLNIYIAIAIVLLIRDLGPNAYRHRLLTYTLDSLEVVFHLILMTT